ncbi:aminotransferase class V-fold PLP-dependent enzyme [Mammaliicoccus sciuri]|nr:aminotransferase class V-fold PLP-dependent enzyme [Mammaliicoccus sciuri]
MHTLQQYFIEQLNDLSFTPIVYKAQAPHIIAVLTPIYEGQYIMQYLSNRNICVSTGTACGHGALLSSGLQVKIDSIPEKTYDQYIRLSIGKFTTRNDIDTCLHHLKTAIRGDQ